jgi:hypothetical protein
VAHDPSGISCPDLRKMSLQGGKKFYGVPIPLPERDLSRFEALVRKRESLLKSIYERRKGEG